MLQACNVATDVEEHCEIVPMSLAYHSQISYMVAFFKPVICPMYSSLYVVFEELECISYLLLK